MTLFFNLFGKPILFAIVITYSIKKIAHSSSSVYNDYVWMFALLLSIVGIMLQSKILNLEEKLENIQKELEELKGTP